MLFVVMERTSSWYEVAQILLLFLQPFFSTAQLYTTGIHNLDLTVITVLFLPSLLSSLSAAVSRSVEGERLLLLT